MKTINDMTQTPFETMSQQGFEQLGLGNYENAIDAFTACLAINPNSSKVLQGRGMAHIQIKAWPKAQTDFAAAYALDADDVENAVGLGMSLAMLNQIYEGISVLEKFLERFPTSARVQIQLGQLNIKLGAITKGKEYLKNALTCRPNLAERRMIESVLSQQEQLDNKRFYRPDFEALRKANGIRPFSAPAWWVKLMTLLKIA
jgi:tetratricopeptide (TPR) repeat protein